MSSGIVLGRQQPTSDDPHMVVGVARSLPSGKHGLDRPRGTRPENRPVFCATSRPHPLVSLRQERWRRLRDIAAGELLDKPQGYRATQGRVRAMGAGGRR